MKIKLQSCTIGIGKKEILKNINFNLIKGTFIHLKGKNGSGKTVFMQSLLGFNKVLKGTRISRYQRDKICYIPDTSFFNDNESIRDVLKATSHFYKAEMSVLYNILNHLQFDESVSYHQKVASLSKGTKKKLELLPLFIDGLDLYFLDEIMTGLDTNSLIIVCARLKFLKEQNATLIMTEHNHHVTDYLNHLIPDIQEVTCINQKVIQD